MASVGIFFFPTDYPVRGLHEPEDRTSGPPAMTVVEVARAAEERGLESLLVPEHTHIPTPRRTPWPGGPALPTEYWHTLDPFVALGAAAAVTERLRLGTAIAIAPQRDPFSFAKQAASLDWLSGGRVLLGVGSGWNAEEMEDHGVRYRDRWKVTREHVLAMRRIWADERAEYRGEHVSFGPLLARPKPVQPGGPPVFVGAQSPWVYDRVVEYADGWMPIFVPGLLEPGDAVDRLRAAAGRAGRAFESIQLACLAFDAMGGAPPLEFLRGLAELGFTRLILRLPSVERDEGLAMLDAYAEVARRLADQGTPSAAERCHPAV